LWPPQRGVGLREPNLGKTNPRVSLHYSLAICFAPSLADSIILLTLTRLVVVFIFVNFSFALFTPPLGDYQQRQPTGDVGGEQHELPGGEIAKGDGTGADSSGEPWRAPPKQAAHQVERLLRLKAVRMTKRSHGECGGVDVEQRSMKAKARRRLGDNAKR
jgi:hypothetical protein